MTDAPLPPPQAVAPAPQPVAAPAVAAYPYGAQAPTARRSPRLGQVAAIIGIALFVASIAVSILMGIAAGPHVEVGPNGFNANFSANDPDPAVRALAFGGFAHIALGGLFGTWAIVQGIVAIATNRGRGLGVLAVILGVVTPVISLAVYFGVVVSSI
jgi:hypothetical protein